MKLAQLVQRSDVKVWPNTKGNAGLSDIEINRVTLDSRSCGPGTLFVAARGATLESRDGHAFIAQAIASGANAIAVESVDGLAHDIRIPVLVSGDCRKQAALWSEQLHDFPSRHLGVAGVTGTNGKTTTTFFLASILKHAGYKASVLGTLGIGDVDSLQCTGFTTPEAEVLSASLEQLRAESFSHVAMEVSSHALSLFRCDGIHFSAAAFLNLSEDHLDFHKDMASYRSAKERLLLELLPAASAAIVPMFNPLVEKLQGLGRKVMTFGRVQGADIYVSDVNFEKNGMRVRLHLLTQSEQVTLPVFGDYNLENVMCAAGLALAQGVPSKEIFRALANIKSPPGRLERIVSPCAEPRPLVFVDFAHTPDALQKVLEVTRAFTKRSLRLVFGCGGNRDRLKRPMMGNIASQSADEIWITNDNPRHEDPNQIVSDICSGIDPSLRDKMKVVSDRQLAISEAIAGAHVDDVVIVAGKGHETTQQIGDDCLPFSDKIIAQVALEGWRQ